MSENTMKRLSAKFANEQDQSLAQNNQIEELLDAHLDEIAAAAKHVNKHGSVHANVTV